MRVRRLSPASSGSREHAPDGGGWCVARESRDARCTSTVPLLAVLGVRRDGFYFEFPQRRAQEMSRDMMRDVCEQKMKFSQRSSS